MSGCGIRLSNCAAELSANGRTRSQNGAMKACVAPMFEISGCQPSGSAMLSGGHGPTVCGVQNGKGRFTGT